MSPVMNKEEAHKLIDLMPLKATWDDLMREIYIHEAIERGLADSNAGRTKDLQEVRAKYSLSELKPTGQLQLREKTEATHLIMEH